MTPSASYINQNSLTSYPLVATAIVDDFIVDAQFTVLDNQLPVLQSVQVLTNSIAITVLLEQAPITVTLSLPDTKIAFYKGDRCVGRLLFGNGVNQILATQSGQTVELNISFLPNTVQCIPTKAGVFSINGSYGTVNLVGSSNIDFKTDGDELIVSAFPSATTPPHALKTLNGVLPVESRLVIQENEIMKIRPSNTSISFSAIAPLNSTTILTEN